MSAHEWWDESGAMGRPASSTEVDANSSPDPSRAGGQPRSHTEGESLLDEESSGDAEMNK